MTNVSKIVTNSRHDIQDVTLTPTEFLLVMTVVKILKKVAIEQHDNDEAELMTTLIELLLTYEYDADDNALIKLPVEARFAFYMAMDNYREFSTAKRLTKECHKANTIMNKFQ